MPDYLGCENLKFAVKEISPFSISVRAGLQLGNGET